MFSFTVHGTPWRRPSGPPAATAAIGVRRQPRSASSVSRRTTALRLPVHLLDPGEVGLDHLAAGDLLAGDLSRQFECPQLPQLASCGPSWRTHEPLDALEPARAPCRPPSCRGGRRHARAVGAGSTWCGGASRCALVVSLSLQVGVNYANDYSDGVRGTDDVRVGPVRLVASGLASPSSVKRAALLAFGVAAVAGLAIALRHVVWLLAVGAAAIAAGWFYTGGPKPYGYLGLGELFVFVFFGLVATVRHDVRGDRGRHRTVGRHGLRRRVAGVCAARDQQPA